VPGNKMSYMKVLFYHNLACFSLSLMIIQAKIKTW
jgi:hypothetical protein